MTDEQLWEAVREPAMRSSVRFLLGSPALAEVLRAAVDAALAQPAQEPVAYRGCSNCKWSKWPYGQCDGCSKSSGEETDDDGNWEADDAAQPAQQEPCYCDKNGIGEPGVSCGDCPTRDYKQPAQQERKPLTTADIHSIADDTLMLTSECDIDGIDEFARAIEQAHGIGSKT